MEREISGAAVLLVPHTRYFQSAIALRALELGTPVALARNSFAAHVLDDAPGLFNPGDGAREVAQTVQDTLAHQRPYEVFATYCRRADESWKQLL